MTDHELTEEEQRSRIDLAPWRRLLAHARPYRGPLAGLAACGLVLAGADATLPLVTGRVIDSATQPEARAELGKYCLLYLVNVAVIAALIWRFIGLAGRTVTGFAHDLRRAAFARLQELSFSFYDRRPVGWLMARLTSDASRLASVIPWTLLDMVWGTALVAGISVMMLVLEWRLALLVMLVLPPLAVVSRAFQQRLLRTQRAVRRVNSQITAGFNEGIMGARTTKSLVREAESLAEFQVLSTEMYRSSVRNALQAALYLPIVLAFGSIGVGLALWRGGLLSAGGLSLGELVAFMQYAAIFTMPIQEMAERFTQFQAAQASAERLQGLLDTEPEIKDSSEAAAPPPDGARIETVEFVDVSFAYKESEPVLDHFNLRVRAGESIALVGATGSGKTTIVSLLCRFYEPTAGTIEVNGIDYRRRGLAWLQSRLGVVLQTPHLFSGTIRENIRYGRLAADEDEIVAAARLANADRFITSLPEGYGTPVGEGGNRLSTGQKQLVALARAVLADPQIFVLDEATSSVDTETERLIQDGIRKVLAGRLSLVIAHRLSTIRAADRILVIDRGRIVEEGRHEDLLRLRGRYHRLYTNQFTEETRERVLAGA